MSTVLMPYDRYKEAEKALAENAILRERLAAAERERDELRLKTAMTLGVGEGSGQLFVHGDYESIKACQRIIFEREAFWKKLDAMEIERDEANESARQAIERIAGYIGMIEGLVARIKAEWGKPLTVIGTGGIASLFESATTAIDHFDHDLTILGLLEIFRRNPHVPAQ